MTLNEMIIELWDMLGRPMDLMPISDFTDDTTIDTGSTGYARIVAWLKEGFNKVINYKPTGLDDYHRFPMLSRKRVVTPDSVSAAFTNSHVTWPSSVSGTGSIMTIALNTLTSFPILSSMDNNSYLPTLLMTVESGTSMNSSWLATVRKTVAGIVYLDVYANDGEVFTTDTLDSTSTFKLHLNTIDISTIEENPDDTAPGAINNNTFIIQSIKDINRQYMLQQADRKEDLITTINDESYPTYYYVGDKYIYLDRSFDIDRSFEIEYRIVSVNDLATALPYIPEQFHNLCVLWGAYKGKLRQQETDVAYAFRGDFINDIKTLMSTFEYQKDIYDGGFIA